MQPVKFLKFLRQFVVLVERNLQLIWNDKLLLASLTLGILNIWLLPYMAQSNIAFFQEIKKIKGVGFFPPRPEDDDQFRPHDPFGEDNW